MLPSPTNYMLHNIIKQCTFIHVGFETHIKYESAVGWSIPLKAQMNERTLLDNATCDPVP